MTTLHLRRVCDAPAGTVHGGSVTSLDSYRCVAVDDMLRNKRRQSLPLSGDAETVYEVDVETDGALSGVRPLLDALNAAPVGDEPQRALRELVDLPTAEEGEAQPVGAAAVGADELEATPAPMRSGDEGSSPAIAAISAAGAALCAAAGAAAFVVVRRRRGGASEALSAFTTDPEVAELANAEYKLGPAGKMPVENVEETGRV